MECSLLPRRPCRFGGARRPRAWCRRRPAALAAPRRAASVTSRALRGVFWHVSAWHRRHRKLAFLACGRGRAGGHARLGDAPRGSSSSRPAMSQHGSSLDGSLPSMLSALCTASTSCLGRPTWPGRAASGEMALNATMTTSSRSGRRRRACAARCSTAGCSPQPHFQQCLLTRFSRCNRFRGPAPVYGALAYLGLGEVDGLGARGRK